MKVGERRARAFTNKRSNVGGVVDAAELHHVFSSGESEGKDTTYGLSCVMGWERHERCEDLVVIGGSGV